MRILPIFASLAFFFATSDAPVRGDDQSERTQIAARIRRLDPSNSQKERLEAVRWFIGHAERPSSTAATPALIRCLKNDGNAEVRGKAAEAVGLIAN